MELGVEPVCHEAVASHMYGCIIMYESSDVVVVGRSNTVATLCRNIMSRKLTNRLIGRERCLYCDA